MKTEKKINDIYGILYRPNTNKKVPLIIFCHGLGSNHSSGEKYAKHYLKLGYAFYEFDFRNGGKLSKSGNDMTKMSVMTEVDDLLEITKEIKKWDFIDQDNIILLGASQGGLVSALAASRIKVKELILLYPAFVISDVIHKTIPNKENIPETINYEGWVTLGKKYALDIWDLDAYEEASKYKGKVLIIHGTSDHLVPHTYSQKAKNIYKDAKLKLIEGADHGFHGKDLESALNFIDENLI